MVAPIPTLSPKDRALLTLFIAVRFNLMELAREAAEDLLVLQDWALQPHIQAHIARYRQLETLQHETQAADAKSAGVAALLELLTTTQDPIERRRAAQTLIRVGSPDPARAESKRPSPAPSPRPTTPQPDEPELEDELDLELTDSPDEDRGEDLDEDFDETDITEPSLPLAAPVAFARSIQANEPALSPPPLPIPAAISTPQTSPNGPTTNGRHSGP